MEDGNASLGVEFNKLELNVRLALAARVGTSAVFELVVDVERLPVDVFVDLEAGFTRSISNNFDATSWPALSPATMVSPQLGGEVRDHSRTVDLVEFAETAVVVMLVELKPLVLIDRAVI